MSLIPFTARNALPADSPISCKNRRKHRPRCSWTVIMRRRNGAKMSSGNATKLIPLRGLTLMEWRESNEL